ncbi:MAG: AAA family ATPase [Patescibacteria group bacterium]|nr:AAA family ATPase [Patescibacteria group bacterium]
MQKIILGFVGDLAAGKGAICKYLKEKYGINSYRFSTPLRDVLDRLYVEKNRENLQKLSTVIRENFSQDILSKIIAEDAVNDKNEIVAVEGIRRPSDIVYLEKIDGFHLVYITAESKLRWERLVKRNENLGDDKKTYEEFLRDEQAEADRLIKELGKKCEFTINNNGNFGELYENLENILNSLRKNDYENKN